MSSSQKRILMTGLALSLAILGVFMANFVFSGDSERYARFVAGKIRHWLVIGALASFAMVATIPVCWRGNVLQRFIAAVLIVIAALVLALCYEVLA